MYFQGMLEIIKSLEKEADGMELKERFVEKFGSGSTINMNRALKILREKGYVESEIRGRKIFYWKKQQTNKYKKNQK